MTTQQIENFRGYCYDFGNDCRRTVKETIDPNEAVALDAITVFVFNGLETIEDKAVALAKSAHGILWVQTMVSGSVPEDDIAIGHISWANILEEISNE